MKHVIPVSILNNNYKAKNFFLQYPFQNPNEIKKASIFCKKKYNLTIKGLSKDLNRIHKINWPVRSWKILIGPWLARCIETTYEKWGIVKKLKKKNKLIFQVPKKIYDFGCFDMENFANKTQTTEWNEQIISYLIYNYTKLNIKEKIIKSKKKTVKKIKIYKILSDYFFIFISKFLNLFQKKNDGVIYNSYISGFINKFILNFKLKLIPQIHLYQNYENKKDTLQNNQENLIRDFKLKNKNKFDKILEDLINKMFPRIYLENFKNLKLLSKKNTFSKKPKFIFTSCAPILKDESFKCWISRKITKSTKLFIMQHGGVYGTSYFQPTVPRHELDVANYFLSWGWGGSKKIIKVPCPLIVNHSNKWNKKGKILFIFTGSRKYFTTFQCDSLWGERSKIYHQDQIEFINKLPKKILNDFNFRFHPSSHICKEYITSKISKNLASLIHKNNINKKIFSKTMSEHRLLIFNYNSTGFIEGIGTNIPSILFLNNTIMPFSMKEKKIFMKLKKVGILHFNHKSLISHLKKINSDVESWWLNKEVIEARKKFCKKFALYDKNYLNQYLSVINESKNNFY